MTSAIDLRPDHRKIVESILRKYLPHGVRAWVFGSRADWTTKESSDLDLALEGDGPLDTRTLMALELAFEESLLPFSVDVVDLERVDDGFRERVVSTLAPLVLGEATTPRPDEVAPHIPKLPEEWDREVLGDVVDIVLSSVDKKAVDGEIPVTLCNYTDVYYNQFIRKKMPFMKATATEREVERCRLEPGDVVITKDSEKYDDIGVPSLVRERIGDLVCGYHLAILRSRPGTHGPFLFYAVSARSVQEQFHSLANGITRFGLRKSDIGLVDVRLPPFAEQRAIAQVLLALDDRIELNRQMNETLEGMARALFKSWFVDFDPVRANVGGRDPGLPYDVANLFPNRFVDSEFGEIPEGWRVVCINDVCRLVQNGGTPRRSEPRYWNGDVDWFKTSELDDGPLLTSEERISDDGLRESSCKIWPAGTVLVALYASPTVGRLGILETPATANQACSALIVGADFGTLFLFYSLLFSRRHLRSIAVGAAQQNISQDVVRRHRVVVPPPRVARVFESAIDDLYRRRVAYLRERRALSIVRDTLLPKLVSGEVRLPAAFVARYAGSDQRADS